MDRFNKKIFTLITFFLFFAIYSFAQQYHFIYLQADNKQPFYIKTDKKILTSSPSGYLIISKLIDGDYIFTIGFPNNEWPEQNVKCTVKDKNEGYLLKYFGEKTWGLFNIQTMEVVKAVEKHDDNIDLQENKNNSIATNAIVKDSSSITAKPVATPIVSEKTDVAKSNPSKIIRLLSTTNLDGAEMIYIDENKGKLDTIRIFVPVDKNNPTKQVENTIVSNTPQPVIKEEIKPTINADTIKQDVVVNNTKPDTLIIPRASPKVISDNKNIPTTATAPKFIEDISNSKTETNVSSTTEETKIISKPVVKVEAEQTIIPNSDCKNIATDDDFIKLRKKMVSENTDEDMIDMAKKIFKTKCFTTDQIKNLGVLFLNDKGKYNFFDTAYPYVSDSNKFSLLETQLTDSYYINRFKAMLRH